MKTVAYALSNGTRQNHFRMGGLTPRHLVRLVEDYLTQTLQTNFPYPQPFAGTNAIRVELMGVGLTWASIFWPLTSKPQPVSELRVELDQVPDGMTAYYQTDYCLRLHCDDDFTVINGHLTIYNKADAHLPVIPCFWYESAPRYTLRRVEGYMIGSVHIPAENVMLATQLAYFLNQTLPPVSDPVYRAPLADCTLVPS